MLVGILSYHNLNINGAKCWWKGNLIWYKITYPMNINYFDWCWYYMDLWGWYRVSHSINLHNKGDMFHVQYTLQLLTFFFIIKNNSVIEVTYHPRRDRTTPKPWHVIFSMLQCTRRRMQEANEQRMTDWQRQSSSRMTLKFSTSIYLSNQPYQ